MVETDATTGTHVPLNQTLEHAEIAIDAPEPWEGWETRLVVWSVLVGIAGLVVFGTLINIYLLK